MTGVVGGTTVVTDPATRRAASAPARAARAARAAAGPPPAPPSAPAPPPPPARSPSRGRAWCARRTPTRTSSCPASPRDHRVSGRDAAFTTELFYGSLRAQGRLDAIIAACVDRPLAKVEPAALDVLRLGAYQPLDMTVAPHAATSETVALARAEVGAGGASFANAVLRRVGEKDLATWIAEVAPDREKDPTGHLAVVHSHPRWVVRALSDALAGNGRSRDEIDQSLEAQNQAPAVSLVMRPGLTDLDELIDHGASRGRLSVFAAAWPSGDPGGMDLVKQGRVAVQDEGSQLAALSLALGADDLVLADDAHWLDLCSGPGGKTALLGGLTIDHDADLLAVEPQEHRTELVDRAVASLREAGREITTLTADGTTIGAERPGEFSRVLADVPCSGLGARAAGPRPAGAAPPPTSASSARSSATC
uniref:transcription antitermination factor NusB n=1 Tax=Brachybacterium sp. GPGPB12 TaxID=3023517 RepID=UPI00404A4B4A